MYKRGKENHVADALSRLPEDEAIHDNEILMLVKVQQLDWVQQLRDKKSEESMVGQNHCSCQQWNDQEGVYYKGGDIIFQQPFCF